VSFITFNDLVSYTDSLIPANQSGTDDFIDSLANQTNPTIKGTVGTNIPSSLTPMTQIEPKTGPWSFYA